MYVRDIMTREPRTVRPEDNLSEATWRLWNGDCGVLPVVDGDGKAIGMITDRDIAIAEAMKNRAASSILVREVISDRVFTCGPDDDVKNALQTMRQQRVRRLPVVDGDGKLAGLLSLNDVVLAAERHRDADVNYDDVIQTMQGICEHWSAPTTRMAA